MGFGDPSFSDDISLAKNFDLSVSSLRMSSEGYDQLKNFIRHYLLYQRHEMNDKQKSIEKILELDAFSNLDFSGNTVAYLGKDEIN